MTTRITESAFALILLVVLAPALLVIGALVRLDGGPALSAERRAGRGGRAVRCVVFRTTVWEAASKGRATGIGRFLRAANLDELPLLVSVLRGEMALFGRRDDAAVQAKRAALPRDAA